MNFELIWFESCDKFTLNVLFQNPEIFSFNEAILSDSDSSEIFITFKLDFQIFVSFTQMLHGINQYTIDLYYNKFYEKI